ncbi:cellulose binding domain-containing protein [Niastella koreensis]|nr:cellulose binding domain-containing protein [Niastella koreensis]
MNRILLLITLLVLGWQGAVFAQAPALPVKGTLDQTLITNRSFTNSSQPDTVTIPISLTASYTLEVKARVNSATGRGLDLEGRNQQYKGFRLTLDTARLASTASLTTPQILSSARAGDEYVIRVAVKNDTVFYYQNGAYLQSQPLATIKDIVNGVETAPPSLDTITGPNLIVNWKGIPPDTLGKPIRYGWSRSDGDTTLFNTANSGSGVRYLDINAGSGSNTETYNGATYTGRIMYIRWDFNGASTMAYCFPVTLEANQRYKFSWLKAYINNAGSGPKSMTVGIGTTPTIGGRIATQTFNTTGTRVLTQEDFSFTAQAAGKYYITITGDWALFSIAELSLYKLIANAGIVPRFVFGKNYPAGAVDMQITTANYAEGAWAPDAMQPGPRQTVVLTGNRQNIPTSFNTNFVVPGKTDVHVTGEVTPYVNASVSLNSDNAWLFFDNIKPSRVISDWLGTVTLNGQPAANGSNVRVAIYGNGAVVIPNGIASQQKAITLYTGENFTGDSVSYEIFTIHDSLGVYDNRFRSFRLKRGYSVTLGSNAQGLGFSKVYIADMQEIAVPVMPKGLYDKVSFVRAFKWDYVSKKGWAGGGTPLEQVNATWSYDWSAGGATTVNTQYVPIRQNGGWPDFNTIYNKQNSNHLLGFNEPDHTDQANMTVDQAIDQWPQLLQSGFRLGSPAPSSPNSWLKQFMDKCDSLNYRVDFTAVHCYWNSRVSGGRADSWYSGLLSTYNTYGNKRPIWITEWNNGANWTGEAWPADTASAFQKQLSDLKLILQVFDTTSFIERYSIYNWVQYQRAMVLADTLTPAGKYYAANKSALAYTSDTTVYKPADIYNHTWRIAAPILKGALSTDYKKVQLSWLDINGDLGTKYVIERKTNKDTAYIRVAELFLDSNYAEGGTVNYSDSITYDTARYRISAISYEGNRSWYSASLLWTTDPQAQPPLLTGRAVAATQINLSWTMPTNSRAYRLKRSLTRNGTYTIVADYVKDTTYQDKKLTPDTTYYYTIASLNSGGESMYRDTILVATPVLQTPDSVLHPRIASGDARITLTWDFQYDAFYKVLRATAQSGPYDTIASGIDSLKYVDRGLTNEQDYYYQVMAYNDAGQGPGTLLAGKPVQGQYLYLHFDDTTSSLAEDVWGGNHALLASAAVHNTGYKGQALQLKGTAASYAMLRDTGAVKELTDFTIATWVNVKTLSSWMRIFDFGSGTSQYMFLTPQAGTTGGLPILRYGIKNGADEQLVSYPFAFPLNSWTHLAVSQTGSVVKLYVNGQVVATNNAVTVHPANLGATTQNYLGKSQYNDPLLNGLIDEFRIYNYALSDTEVNRLASGLELKKYQVITFAAPGNKRIGDEVALSALASSGLPVSYISSDSTIAQINNQGIVALNRAGAVTITAVQPGNDLFNGAQLAQAFTVLPYNVSVQHVNANGASTTSNSIRPYLKVVNNDSVPLNYKGLTMRYWLTPENYSGLNVWIDYAALGNTVKAQYVSLPEPKNGAFGYVEYLFDSAAGVLPAGGNTGAVQSRISNTNWGNFNEQDDYSYTQNTTYTLNEKITLYRNGKLIGGTEPAAVAPVRQFSVLAQTLGSGQNTINTNIQLKNTGNVPVNYEDIKLRYWFTADGNAPLQSWIDYAALGASNITGAFTRLPDLRSGADAYLEFSFLPSAGVFYPLCNTGNIQSRVAKTDWSVFDQQNDYSTPSSRSLTDNNRITVYYKGQLIAGVEPSQAAASARMKLPSEQQDAVEQRFQLYPNPVKENLIIRLPRVHSGAYCQVYNTEGILVAAVIIRNTAQQLPVKQLAAGIYHIVIHNGSDIMSRKIIKE